MSSLPTHPGDQAAGIFQEVCASSLCRVLGQVSGEPFALTGCESVPPPEREEPDGVWARGTCSGAVTGEIGFYVSQQDAALLSVPLTGEAVEESAELPGNLRIALAGLFRRVAEEMSSALRAGIKQDVELRFQELAPLASPGEWRYSLQLQGTKTAPLTILAAADQAFVDSIAACQAVALDPEDLASKSPGAAPKEDNIELLLDIQLEATLRFGEREMLLGEILKLNPGSVVELNRRVNEPVELLVCGKVIAKGDVVVTDGNYGLRVTQIVSPADRMSSIRS